MRLIAPLDHHDLTALHQDGGDLRAWLAYHFARHAPAAVLGEGE